MWQRILAVLVARNREFYRDTAGLGWNLIMPLMMVLAFAFIFAGEPEDLFKLGVISPDGALTAAQSPLFAVEHLSLVPVEDRSAGVTKVERHQLDLLLDLNGAPRYWVNVESARGRVAEQLLLGSYALAGRDPSRSARRCAARPSPTRTGCCRGCWP